MAVWVYQCQPCGDDENAYFVSRAAIDSMPAGVRRLRIRLGDGWACALVDLTHALEVEGMLVRDAVAAEAGDCAECEALEARGAVDRSDAAPPTDPPVSDPEAGAVRPSEDPLAQETSRRQVQAAAISLHGVQLVVVLVPLELAQSAGEADMLIADLRPRFGNAPLVLMGQRDDGTPVYHGDRLLTELVVDLPIDKMPWKSYPVG